MRAKRSVYKVDRVTEQRFRCRATMLFHSTLQSQAHRGGSYLALVFARLRNCTEYKHSFGVHQQQLNSYFYTTCRSGDYSACIFLSSLHPGDQPQLQAAAARHTDFGTEVRCLVSCCGQLARQVYTQQGDRQRRSVLCSQPCFFARLRATFRIPIGSVSRSQRREPEQMRCGLQVRVGCSVRVLNLRNAYTGRTCDAVPGAPERLLATSPHARPTCLPCRY